MHHCRKCVRVADDVRIEKLPLVITRRWESSWWWCPSASAGSWLPRDASYLPMSESVQPRSTEASALDTSPLYPISTRRNRPTAAAVTTHWHRPQKLCREHLCLRRRRTAQVRHLTSAMASAMQWCRWSALRISMSVVRNVSGPRRHTAAERTQRTMARFGLHPESTQAALTSGWDFGGRGRSPLGLAFRVGALERHYNSSKNFVLRPIRTPGYQ